MWLVNDAYGIKLETGNVNTLGIKNYAMSIITKGQLRAARAMLGWSQEELASRSGVSLPSIKRIEPGDDELSIRLDTLSKIQSAFEKAGVDFTREPGWVGVRLKSPKASE